MMLNIFHRGSINLIKSLSTVEIKVFLTFREAIKKKLFCYKCHGPLEASWGSHFLAKKKEKITKLSFWWKIFGAKVSDQTSTPALVVIFLIFPEIVFLFVTKKWFFYWRLSLVSKKFGWQRTLSEDSLQKVRGNKVFINV